MFERGLIDAKRWHGQQSPKGILNDKIQSLIGMAKRQEGGCILRKLKQCLKAQVFSSRCIDSEVMGVTKVSSESDDEDGHPAAPR